MGANPVNAYDMLVLAATEATLGVTPTPASQAAYGLLALEAIDCNLGPAEAGVVRGKQDRAQGRGMQSGFVEGRVVAIPWTFDTSLKSRALVDTASPLLPFFKAAGIKHTINGGTNVTLTPSPQPIETGDFAGMTLTRLQGSGLGVQLGEVLRGCVAKTLHISGAAGELLAKFAGVGIGKSTASGQAAVMGKVDLVTMLIGATSLTITAEESKRLGVGYYLCESEVIQVTACTPGGTTATIARAALGTAAAAHTAVPFVPYRPTPTYTGAPIAEPTSSVTLGGVTVRARSWGIDLTTGMDLLDPETGSRYSQGAKYVRYDIKAQLQLVLSGDQVSRLGDVQARTNLALVLSQGVGVGGIFTFNAPNCEVIAFTPPSTANDVSIVDIQLRMRDGAATAGNDAWNMVLT